MSELTGKTALVTGGAKRIGSAIAAGLAKEGVNVVVHYSKSKYQAIKLQERIERLGVKSWLASADFNDPDSCKQLIEKAYELSGKLDILVNNASVFLASTIDRVSLEAINAEMLTNTWTPFLLSRYFAEKTDYGKIVNLLDTRIVGYDFNHVAYYFSKRMLEVVTKMLALKFAPKITVNGIAPGLILPPKGKDSSYLELQKEKVPLKKYGSVSNIVDTVLFFLKNDFVTGQIIHVDGGAHLMQTIEGL
jgi:hypothetical protein